MTSRPDPRATVALTDQQQQIVAHNHGPALVYAVAGAGKTTAMVHRVERLVRERVFAAQKILVSSFNKAAVDDLGRALAAWPPCRQVARHTLHALGYKIVRHAAEHGQLPRLARDALKVNGEERQLLWAARDLARQRNLVAPGEIEALDEQDLLSYIGACKGNLRYADLAATRLPQAALTLAGQAVAPPNLPWYLDLYRLHEEVRHERGWLTFDDMLLLGWEALVRHPELLAFWQRSYDAVIVDEFQDVNLAQAELLDLLVQQHRNYMAIGDDDQTIYGFRGASMAFFRNFGQRYQATTYAMTDNFRCQGAQVVLANRVIAQNSGRHPKTLVATRGFAGRTLLRQASDQAALSRSLVEDLRAVLATGLRGAESAILVRLTAQTPPIEQALIAAGIAYRIAGEEPFFRRREIVDLLRYLDLADYDAMLRAGQPLAGVAGEQFAACWRSLYNRPKRYLTRQFLHETTSAVLQRGQPLSELLLELSDKVPERLSHTLHDLAGLLLWLAEAQAQVSAAALLVELDWRLGYQDFLIRNSGFAETGVGYAANVAAFIEYSRGKGSLAQLRTHLAELEAQRAVLAPDAPDAVDIRTIHRAKGLEWPAVFIPNCNAGTIPVGGSADPEEERRLLYVAITRARQELYLYATSGEPPLSPFLSAAGVETTLTRASDLQRLLTGDPATWTAAEALLVLTFPRLYGQERFFSTWWAAPEAQRQRIGGRLLALVEALRKREGLQRLAVSEADIQLWQGLAPAAQALSTPAFPDLERLCPPQTAPAAASNSGSASKRRRGASPPPPPPYRVGESVEHAQFGRGVVVAVTLGKSGRSEEWFVTVEFRSRGLVKLLAAIAPLQPVIPTP